MENSIELVFSKVIQDSQEYGSNNEHMISRVFFSIGEDQYSCNVRQPYGESFSFENDPIEVETPAELKNLFNYDSFRNTVEHYFRMAIGAQGGGIKISGGQNIHMRNNTLGMKHKALVKKSGFDGAW